MKREKSLNKQEYSRLHCFWKQVRSHKKSREILDVEDTNDYFIAQVAICEDFQGFWLVFDFHKKA